MDSLGENNPLIKRIRRAIAHGTLTDDGYAVAEGPHLLAEAVKAGCEIRAVIVSESARLATAKPGMIDDLSRLPEPRTVSDKIFRTLSSTETPQGVLALVKPPVADLASMLAGGNAPIADTLPVGTLIADTLIAILDGVQDPGNAGAIVRVAEAFGATGAIFLKGSVDPFHPRTLRGSAGSLFRLPVVARLDVAHLDMAHRIDADADFDSLNTLLGGLRIYAAMPRATSSIATSSIEVRDADFTVPCAIAIGGEGRGISERLAARAIPVHIPTRNVESLNAAVAAGILFYEARRQRDSAQVPREQSGRSEGKAGPFTR